MSFFDLPFFLLLFAFGIVSLALYTVNDTRMKRPWYLPGWLSGVSKAGDWFMVFTRISQCVRCTTRPSRVSGSIEASKGVTAFKSQSRPLALALSFSRLGVA
jgi:hypothetical protein